MPSSPTSRRVVIVAYPDVQCLDVTGLHEVFAMANRRVATSRYALELVAPGAGVVRASSGLGLVVDHIADLARRFANAGFDALALHWDVMEERAANYGTEVDRNAWRLVGMMHLAETREEEADCLARFGRRLDGAALPLPSGEGERQPVGRRRRLLGKARAGG